MGIYIVSGDDMLKRETIAAISTGMSNSGIGIVRMSGEEVFKIIDRIFKGKVKLSEVESHTIHHGYIVDEKETIDEVLVSVMYAPGTYTGENTVEINCHGGIYVVNKVLETVLKNGARAAEPGEFTKRAFLNGKLDLSQAEAVSDLIFSKNEYARKSSISQLKGSIRSKIENIRKEILYHTAYIETALDDPEHIQIDGYGDTLKNVVEQIREDLKKLIDSSENGKILKEGIQTVILGKTNAGKSSLLNLLSGSERAIVTDVEGTTRDVLEEQIQINGLCLNVVDTAGIRKTNDIVEQIGVDRAKQYAEDANLLIYVVDASRNLDENDRKIIAMLYGKKSIILLNKSDLSVLVEKEKLRNEIKEVFKGINSSAFSEEQNRKEYSIEEIPMIDISVKLERGISEFEETVKQMFFKGMISFNDEIYITNLRQKEALNSAYVSLSHVLESIEHQMPEDFYSIDLMDAYEVLGNITGETIGEDLIHEIFSKFCMGK